MKAIVIIGAGSSAKKFAKILLEKKCKVAIFQHRKNMEPISGCSRLYSLKNLSQFSGAIIASPPDTHLEYAQKILAQELPLLVEKPLSNNLRRVNSLISLAKKKKIIFQIGLNMRFLPVVQKINRYIAGGKLGKVLHAEIYVGQYLPDWRQNKDYRKNYGAFYEHGGGVALDLIHEIDLALRLFPGIHLRPLVSKKLSSLEINTEDYVEFRTNTKPYIRLKLDYLNHVKTRRYLIVGDKGSIECDVIKKSFIYKNATGLEEKLGEKELFDISKTYVSEIDDFLAMIDKKKKSIISEQSLGIDALKTALKARKHV